MSAIKEMVKQSGGEYAIAYGIGTDDDPEKIVDIQLYARQDAAEALEPILREFERIWAETPDSSEPKFTLSHTL